MIFVVKLDEKKIKECIFILRRPARGGSTTAIISFFVAFKATQLRISSAFPLKNCVLFTPFNSAFAFASAIASDDISRPKTSPHF